MNKRTFSLKEPENLFSVWPFYTQCTITGAAAGRGREREREVREVKVYSHSLKMRLPNIFIFPLVRPLLYLSSCNGPGFSLFVPRQHVSTYTPWSTNKVNQGFQMPLHMQRNLGSRTDLYVRQCFLRTHANTFKSTKKNQKNTYVCMQHPVCHGNPVSSSSSIVHCCELLLCDVYASAAADRGNSSAGGGLALNQNRQRWLWVRLRILSDWLTGWLNVCLTSPCRII